MNTIRQLCALAALASAFLLHARENEIEHQEITLSVRLTRTEAAPSNAVGAAELEVDHHDASRSNRIEIHTSGLATGTYTVTVFDRAGAQGAVLGTMVAGISDDALPDDSGHHRNGGRESSDDTQRQGGDDDGEGEGKFIVPDSINALELGRIVIADSGGIEMLIGDFSDLSNTITGHFSAHVLAGHGGGDDDASGFADIKGRVRRGRGHGQFTLTGQNLPPSTVLMLVINGEDKGAVRTNRRGRLHVRRNHRTLDVFSISTVSVRDDSGAEVLKAQF